MNCQDAKDAKKNQIEEPLARLDLLAHSVIGATIESIWFSAPGFWRQSLGALGVLAVDP